MPTDAPPPRSTESVDLTKNAYTETSRKSRNKVYRCCCGVWYLPVRSMSVSVESTAEPRRMALVNERRPTVQNIYWWSTADVGAIESILATSDSRLLLLLLEVDNPRSAATTRAAVMPSQESPFPIFPSERLCLFHFHHPPAQS